MHAPALAPVTHLAMPAASEPLSHQPLPMRCGLRIRCARTHRHPSHLHTVHCAMKPAVVSAGLLLRLLLVLKVHGRRRVCGGHMLDALWRRRMLHFLTMPPILNEACQARPPSPKAHSKQYQQSCYCCSQAPCKATGLLPGRITAALATLGPAILDALDLPSDLLVTYHERDLHATGRVGWHVYLVDLQDQLGVDHRWPRAGRPLTQGNACPRLAVPWLVKRINARRASLATLRPPLVL